MSPTPGRTREYPPATWFIDAWPLRAPGEFERRDRRGREAVRQKG